MSDSPKGSAPLATKTFRVRDLMLCRQIVEGLVNHRQWFIFCPLLETNYPNDEYEFVLDSETPVSGYGFIPTSDVKQYENEGGYGLEIT